LIIGIDVHIIIEEVPSTEDVFDGERREFPKVTFIRLHGIERIEIGGVGKIDHAVRLTEKTSLLMFPAVFPMTESSFIVTLLPR